MNNSKSLHRYTPVNPHPLQKMPTRLKQLKAGMFLAFSVACLPLQGADAKLSDWDLGTVQVGEKVAMKDLKGQVVVFEYWGTR